MKKILLAALAMGAMTTVAMAEPVKLQTAQADGITAGVFQTNVSSIFQQAKAKASATAVSFGSFNKDSNNAVSAASATNAAQVGQANFNF